MKRTLLLFAVLVGAVSILWVGVTQAANVRSGDAPMVMDNETINGTLYAAGREITIDGTVQGDLMCAGQKVMVNGTIEGDVLCAAQDITVRGEVHGDVRVLAQDTTIEAKIAGSVSVVAQTVNLSGGNSVARDATLLSQSATVNGSIGRDVESLGGNFATAAIIGRDLDVTAETVTLRDKTQVAGTFMYVSQQDAKMEGGAQAGRTEHKYPDQQQQMSPTPGDYLNSVIFGFISFVIMGLALLAVAPRVVGAAANSIAISPLATAGTGIIALIVPPFAAIVLMITAVGLPLAFVVFLAWVLSLITAMVFTGLALGRAVMAKMQWNMQWQNVISLLLGLFILFLLSLVPFVGGFVAFAAVVWGVGGVWYTAFKKLRGAPPTAQPQQSKEGKKAK